MLPIVVLAGGLATRLRPVSETIPKSLIPINDAPFVMHQLALLKKSGFKNVHFCLGYLGQLVEDAILQSEYINSINITFSYDGDKLLGTGGAVRKILNELPDNFFITYGDSYLDIDYKEIENYFNRNKKNDTTSLMTVFKNEGKWDTSNVIFENNKILLYSKRIKDPKMQYIDYGLGILAKNNFKGFPENENFDIAEIYEKLSIDKNLLGLETIRRFYEVGSFSGIEDISNYIKLKK